MQDAWGVIFNSIGYFCLNAATVVFLHCFYDAAFLWNKKKALLFLSGTIIQAVVTFVFPDLYTLINWIFLIPYCFVATYDYSGKKKTGLWRFFKYFMFLQTLAVVYGVLVTICTSQETFESLLSAVSIEFVSDGSAKLNYTQLNIGNTLISHILSTVFYSTVFFFSHSLYKKGVVIRCGKREIWLILAVSFLSYILLYVVMYGMLIENDIYLRYALALLGIVFSFLFPFFVYYTRIGEYHRKKTAVQEQHIQAELAHFQQYKQTQEETSRFRHDIRNNLLCINDMLQQGKSDDASEYLKDLLEIVENTSRKHVTGDDLLDSIVGVKAQIMEQHGIRFELDGVLAGGLTWKPMDICNVFANALDNAIEACQKVAPDKRWVSMNIKSTPQFWFVTITNPVTETVDTSKLFQKNGGYTSKSNSASHGIGTYNMKHTVEAYGAMLKADCTNKIFKLEIMIDKSSPE